MVTLAVASVLAGPAFGDVVQLRDKATVTGKVLVEKKDLIVVDIGGYRLYRADHSTKPDFQNRSG
jgi:hypothetical protein